LKSRSLFWKDVLCEICEDQPEYDYIIQEIGRGKIIADCALDEGIKAIQLKPCDDLAYYKKALKYLDMGKIYPECVKKEGESYYKMGCIYENKAKTDGSPSINVVSLNHLYPSSIKESCISFCI
jgi:hypothetical protein